MKTRRFFVVALACVAAMSCVKEAAAPEQTSQPVSFVAEKESFDATKAVLVDGVKTEWKAGDAVAVFDGTASHKFTAAADGARVGFTTTSTTVNTAASAYLFLYPYSETAVADVPAGKVTFNVPAVQTAVTGSFDPMAAVAVASAAPADLLPGSVVKAKNALALLKVAVPADLSGKTVKIAVEAKGGEALAGDVVCEVATKANEMKAGGEASATVTLAAAPPMTEGVYYIAVRPCTVASGVKVTVTLGDKTYYTRESSASFTFEANHIYNMGTVGTSGWNVTTYQYTVSTVSGAAGRADTNVIVDGDASSAKWRNLDGLAWMPDGRIMVADRGNQVLRIFDPATTQVTTWITQDLTKMKTPWRMDYLGNDLYVANKDLGNIIKIDQDKNITEVAALEANILEVRFDKSGNMYVVSRNANKLYKFTGTDAATKVDLASVTGPISMEFANDGSILVFTNQRKLYQIAQDGTTVQIAGNGTKGTSDGTPGMPLTANLGVASGSVIAADGTLYYPDSESHTIKMMTPDANGSYEYAYISTIAGAVGKSGKADGVGTSATFYLPYDIIMTADENTCYISDVYNYMLRKMTVSKVTEKCGMNGDHEDYGGTDGIVTIF